MKKQGSGLILFLFAAIICINESAAQLPIIKDVRGEIFGDNAQIIVEANCDVDYLDYTLENPPRLIIDPVGKIYSDLKEVITFDSGPVKKILIVKSRAEEGMTGNFYPLDFISIELDSLPEYKVRREVKQEIIVDIEKRKEVEVKVSKVSPVIEELAAKEEIKEEVKPLPTEPEVKEEVKEIIPLDLSLVPSLNDRKDYPLGLKDKKVYPLGLEEPKKEAGAAVSEPIKVIYTIGEGDLLDICVWQHSELDKKVVVRPDGFISFPLVGDVKAMGLTPPQLSSSVKEKLSRLIKDPQVTVIVSGFGSKNIFVLGEVGKPGSYTYRGGMTVLDAIGEAAGWKNSAVLNSVMVVRKVFTDAPQAHRLNVYALIKNGDFSQNLPLESGDIVYVPKSFIANIGGFIENLKVSVGAYITESTKVFD